MSVLTHVLVFGFIMYLEMFRHMYLLWFHEHGLVLASFVSHLHCFVALSVLALIRDC